MDARKRNTQIESFLVVVLLIVFCVMAAILIAAGHNSFSGIMQNKDEAENIRIAHSFLHMRIRQHDLDGRVAFLPQSVENRDAIGVYHYGPEEGLMTYLYQSDEQLWECYIGINETPTQNFSFEIIPLQNLAMGKNGHRISIQTTNQRGVPIKRIIALRTPLGGHDEE